MPVAFTNLTSGSELTTAGLDSVTASITLTANRLALLSVIGMGSSVVDLTIPTCSGWTQISTSQFSVSTVRVRLTVFRRLAATDLTGTHTIASGGDVLFDALWSIDQSDASVDTGGTNGSGAIVQSVVSTGVGTAPLATLAAFSSANNSTFGSVGFAYSPGTLTQGSGFTLLAAVNGGGNDDGLLTESRTDNDTTVDASCTISTDWAVLALEIKAAPPPVGSLGQFDPEMRLAAWF